MTRAFQRLMRICSLLCLVCSLSIARGAEPAPDFNREIRPILSQFCFKCHGPDETTRASGVRLDLREAALHIGESGAVIIAAGAPDRSELMQRIESDDPYVVMPPPATNLKLTNHQKQLLRRWIAAGAPYAPHWAFVAPQRAPLPAVKQSDWPRNAIDHFILAEVEQRGWTPAAEADRYTLARRAALDLTGLPPTPEAARAFVEDPRPDAYERYVDGLLASPRYGERWARKWLDLARYADTNGYEKDRPRTVWPYRDWVIQALNADLPFDQFTIEQIAGDMLPGATQSQRIATGFHRNTMLNEEGGIDPLEFRFHSLTDRVATTGATWLGMTVGCAQCHTHKYDPIQHTDYYRLMAFLNNADEPELEVPPAEMVQRRKQLEAEIRQREKDLPARFPPCDAWTWQSPRVVEATSANGAKLDIQDDGAILVTGDNPEVDTYTIILETSQPEVSAIQVEALTDASLGHQGPGRTPHGNFVVTELQVEQQLNGEALKPVQFQAAMADFSQDKFPAEHAIDAAPHSGWAIHGPGQWNVPRTLTARFSGRVRQSEATRWVVRLEQSFGGHHTLGKFRIRLGALTDTRPARVRRTAHFDEKFGGWLKQQTEKAVAWTVAKPVSWQTTLPRLELQADNSLLASGDLTKRDVYDIDFGSELNGATAIRIEALPDESLPRRGPGAVYYEGPRGDFYLSEIQWLADQPDSVKWAGAAHSFANAHHTAAAATDGNPLTGWSIDGGQGKPHVAVFRFAQPLAESEHHRLKMIFERYYAPAMGRFRVAYTKAAQVPAETALASELETVLTTPAESRTPEMQQFLVQTFCQTCPELASERAAIDQLRQQLPEFTTALVFRERPADHPRQTHRHHRGEYLQAKEVLEPGVPGFLHPLPESAAADRLTLARWLVDRQNPLVARVVVNRHWATLFGRGLVRTQEDFGYQGELPTHPQLLDWLAVEFMDHDWSVKELHRLLVTSATYRQSSQTSEAQHAADPLNLWLAHGPRVRLEAELVRDSLLQTAGLLSDKLLGPSVYPPQPANVTTEGAYGKLTWAVSTGEDRYRRGLYTFSKRTAPYAMFTTFDAPSGEACVPRRESSNTPLQALTLLNDAVFLETARALGTQAATGNGSAEERLQRLFQDILTRPPQPAETKLLLDFFTAQKERLAKGELSASDIAGEAPAGDLQERAAWTATARALLNLDEAITKE